MENIHQNPLVFKIHNGTERNDRPNLCKTCYCGQVFIGRDTGKQTVICNKPTPAVLMQEAVVSCTGYYDRTQPSLSDMQDIAWTVNTDKSGRTVGFKPPEKKDRFS